MVSSPRLVREAEHLMRISGPETPIGEIAARAGVSLRTLEVAFREYRDATPTQYRRRIRLDAARAKLLDPCETTTVTSVALDHGFFHLARFSAHYKQAFDELPSQTLRRSRSRSRTTIVRTWAALHAWCS
jgi:transcriptional regulator GlxA family with amidase domain